MPRPLSSVSLALAFAFAAGSALAQPSSTFPSDPSRWHEADQTLAQQNTSAVKEAKAALHESLRQCQAQSPDHRQACAQRARDEHQKNLATLRQTGSLVSDEQTPQGGVYERHIQ